MKGLFPGYAKLSDQEEKDTWLKATFVFDTNVLLDLYSYQEHARDSWLSALNQISERIWIPYHVALEFQKNRLVKISEQTKSFTSARRVADNALAALRKELSDLETGKQHAATEVFKPLLEDFSFLVSNFTKKLDDAKGKYQKPTDADPLKGKIELLFDNKVGSPPESQEIINSLYIEAQKRFDNKIPPGYIDRTDKGDSEHRHNGIVYTLRYGDYIIWRQLLDHAKTNELKHVIFVTGDNKEDWWHDFKFSGEPPKRIGPRREIIEEASREADIEVFLMYTPVSFLERAGRYLNTTVSQEILAEVQEVSDSNKADLALNTLAIDHFRFSAKARLADQVVTEWLKYRFEILHESVGPDFTEIQARRANKGVFNDGEMFDFMVKYVSIPQARLSQIQGLLKNAVLYGHETLSQVAVVFVADNNAEDIKDLHSIIASSASLWEIPDNLHVIIGSLYFLESGIARFNLIYDLLLKEAKIHPMG